MYAAVLVLCSFVYGLPRVLGHHSEAYQAVAHVFVGGLFGAWLKDSRDRVCLWCGLGLSVLEVACFLYYGKQP